MSLDIWQKKIQDKRKNTPFRDFLLEVASWWSINLYRNNNNISFLPLTQRSGKVVWLYQYYREYDNLLDGIWNNSDFFSDFASLFINHAKPAIFHVGSNENADYCNTCFGTKNAYLSFVSWFNTENIFYSTQTWENTSNVFNSSLVTNWSNNIYSSRVVQNSFNIFYSQYIYNSSDMWFCSSCIGCHYCINCDGLENMSYCINNIQYNEEEFNDLKTTYTRDIFSSLHTTTFARKWQNFSCTDVIGYGLYKCHNSINLYNSMNYNDSRNVVFSDGLTWVKSYYDCIDTGTNSNDFYAVCQWGEDSSHCYMCNFVSMWCFNIFYSIHMENCSFCLGCIGLKNKSYCILNKQYTKEERHAKVDEIFNQMDKEGILGDFFPATMNPFYFNDTAAYLIDPSFTKEEVTTLWYLWRDEPIKVDIPVDAEVVTVNALTDFESLDVDGSWHIDPNILNKIIVDEEGNYYKIVKMEYDFLIKHGLPLPRKHRLDRMKENFNISLW